ncbi:hypothetical protein JK358_37155 [Nocardia sp. 2]|uniref:ESX-1 secretion-associated protein n=1 Tax=Nocardia acididurans TaxID=2802282 RepID=A0ABS1MJ15_9NOCA|nr:hypothetical protein [Nocardia acididurans]MBL1080040.1 hypothetical protein [Nocardia acididurans]
MKLQAEEVRQTSEHWDTAKKNVVETPLDTNALGQYGKEIAGKLNLAGANLASKLRDGSTAIQTAADGLKTCATHFEGLDADYYRQFGYIDAQLGY